MLFVQRVFWDAVNSIYAGFDVLGGEAIGTHVWRAKSKTRAGAGMKAVE